MASGTEARGRTARGLWWRSFAATWGSYAAILLALAAAGRAVGWGLLPGIALFWLWVYRKPLLGVRTKRRHLDVPALFAREEFAARGPDGTAREEPAPAPAEAREGD